MTLVRPAEPADSDAIWGILEPVFREGETYALPLNLTRGQSLEYWFAPGHVVFCAWTDGGIAGTYFLQPNQKGGGAHVANCGYITAAWASGQGLARAMCAHSLEYAKAEGYRAMQFNLVVSSNERAVRLWQDCGFEIAGRLPEAFYHPRLGYVDAFVMYRTLA